MSLSDLSVKRPVFASVLALLMIAFGLVAFERLPLREYPDIDPPVVTVEVRYAGAAANVVETRVTEVIEERIAGIEGIAFIESKSEDGQSSITVEFRSDYDADTAANDIRDRVFSVLDELPEEARPPEIQKVDSNDDVIVWLNLQADGMSVPELTDYAERYLVDRFSVLDGVARVRIGGGQRFAMRVWLDRNAMAARGLTANDIEAALLSENIELPAGSIESVDRQFTVRTERTFRTPESFAQLVIARGEANGYLVRLGDVARVEKGTEEERLFFRGNQVPMVGLGIIKQSTANTIEVARGASALSERINQTLPKGMSLKQSYDTSVFIEGAIHEVYMTLLIGMVLVVAVLYVFLGNWRATLVPAVTVPVSLIASCVVLLMLDFSLNLLTLLAFVLAIGLVVDDAIVMIENIYRRMQEEGETPLVASYRGARQVGFAVVATSLVLLAVFVPVAFLQGDVGRLFSEFALTMAAAIAFSTIAALSLSPMMASQLLKANAQAPNALTLRMNKVFAAAQQWYARTLEWTFSHSKKVMLAFAGLVLLAGALFALVPSEYAPKEDRGAFFVLVDGPEGATYDYMLRYMNEIEARLMSYVEKGEMTRLLVRAPRTLNNYESFNSGIIIAVLSDWSDRRSAFTMMAEIQKSLSDLPGVRAFPVMRQGFGAAIEKPVQFVLGGGTYESLVKARDVILREVNQNNPGFEGIDSDYKETKPQIEVQIDYDRAAELGVSVSNIGRTLETMLGSRRVTTYIDSGEEYDVLLEGERSAQRSPIDLQNIYVKSERSGELIPLANLVTLREFADSKTLNRYNRVRAITITANLAEGYTLGEALEHLNGLVDTHLSDANLRIDYKGQSQDFMNAGSSIVFVFVLGIVVVFLVLAAQFESYIHPLIILLTVPLAMLGGLLGLFITGSTINIYSQIGLIMLVGLAAKNGILIVEFSNQLRDEGKAFDTALREACAIRLRPILMTGITTAAGAVPLMISSGAGSETRAVIGVVVFFGVVVATAFTLIIVPVAYSLMARNTGSPNDVARRLEREEG